MKMKFELEVDTPVGADPRVVAYDLEMLLKAAPSQVAFSGFSLKNKAGQVPALMLSVRPLRSDFEDVCSFHAKFEIPTPAFPGLLPQDVSDFRMKFLNEELIEYAVAETLEGKVDALVDLVYVALGTARLHGFQWDVHWDEVQAANMRKERVASVDQSKRGHAFDVRKPAGWVGPDHAKIFARYR